MTKEQAIEIIKQVCANFKGTLQEHQQIQTALTILTEEKKDGDTKHKN